MESAVVRSGQKADKPPKRQLHKPLVRMTENPTMWFLLFVATAVSCGIAAVYFGGAGSGIYDVVTQVNYFGLSLKPVIDSLPALERHLGRDGTIVLVAALFGVSSLKYARERMIYAKLNPFDWFCIVFHLPNAKRRLRVLQRQRAVRNGLITSDAEWIVVPAKTTAAEARGRAPGAVLVGFGKDDTTKRAGTAPATQAIARIRPMARTHKLIVVPLVLGVSVLLIIGAWFAYDYLRAHWFHGLPVMGISSLHRSHPLTPVQKLSDIVTSDTKIKVLFLLPMLVGGLFLLEFYDAVQNWIVLARIGKRCRRLQRRGKPLSELSDYPPLHYWTPAWRSTYRYYRDLVVRGLLDVPSSENNRTRRRIRWLVVILTALFVFGRWWIWSHT